MNTIVYISRHSKKDMNYTSNDSLLNTDINRPLNIVGEDNAKMMSLYPEFQDIDSIYSSHYIRSIQTAKYVATNNNLEINIDKRLGERIIGLDENFPKLTPEFAMKQYQDENYKYGNGESRKEVTNRVRESLFEIINKNKGKKIFIVTHSTAMLFLFISFGKFEFGENCHKIIINNKNIIENVRWGEHTPELFKLIFDEDNNLIDINYIRW